MDIYSYTYGVAATEQDFITAVDTFLTVTIGDWTRLDTISDTGTDRDYVWTSPGEDPANYSPIYIRLRGNTNIIHTYGYGVYQDSSTYWQELYNATYSKLSLGAYSLRYWMWGNKDFVCFAILNPASATGATYLGYLGLIDSVYVPETDPYPLLIRGHASEDYTWYSGSGQLLMHAPTASGEKQYGGYNWDPVLDYDAGLRNTNLLLLPVILKCEQSGDMEVRGRPKGVYQVNDNRAPKMAPITTASGVFLIFRDGDPGQTNKTFAYGPVAASIDGFSMW